MGCRKEPEMAVINDHGRKLGNWGESARKITRACTRTISAAESSLEMVPIPRAAEFLRVQEQPK